MTEAASTWTTLPRDLAEQHPLYGIGGWMLVVLLTCAAAPLRAIFHIVPLTSLEYTSFRQDIATLIAAESFAVAVRGLWGVLNMFLILRKHSAFPPSYIASWLAFAGLFIADLVVSYSLLGQVVVAKFSTPAGAGIVAGVIIGTGVWTSYAWSSRRVNVTFRHRVPMNDPMLRNATAAVH